MSGKVGRNTTATANDVRPFVCEIFGGEDGATITNATLFADNAAATFPLSNQPVDPAYSQLCSVEIGLAGLSDETADGDVSTSCDAEVTDIETGKVKNLEPGGNYALEVPMGQSVPSFSTTVAPGSVVVVCGMFCSQVNSKSLQPALNAVFATKSDIVTCIAEALAEFNSGDALAIDCPEDSNKGTLQVNEGDLIPFLKGLFKCGDEGPEALDCNADAVKIEGRVRSTRSTPLPEGCINPECYPDIEPCDNEGDQYFTEGVTFEFIDGAWEAVAFSDAGGGANPIVVAGGGTSTYDEAGVAALTPAWDAIRTMTRVVTNDSCVTRCYRAVARVQASASSNPGNLWEGRLAAGANMGFGQGIGNPNTPFDTVDQEEATYVQQFKTLLTSEWYICLAPGESATFEVESGGRALQYRAPDAASATANELKLESMAARIQSWAQCA